MKGLRDQGSVLPCSIPGAQQRTSLWPVTLGISLRSPARAIPAV